MVSSKVAENVLFAVSPGPEVKNADGGGKQNSFEDIVFSMKNQKDVPQQAVGSTNNQKAEEIKNIFEKNQMVSGVENPKEEDFVEIAQDEVAELLQNIIQKVAEIFEVTPQEVQSAMEEIGAEAEDLLTNSGLTDIITRFTGKQNAMEILTDSEFPQMLKEVFAQVKELCSTFMEQNGIDGQQLKKLAAEIPVSQLVLSETETKPVTEQTAGYMEPPEAADSEPKMDTPVKEEAANISVSSEETPVKTENILREPVQHPEIPSGEKVETFLKDSASGKEENSSLTQNFMNSLTQAMSEFTDIADIDVEPEKIIRQIVERVKTEVKVEMTSMEMQLNPEHLGKIHLQIVSRNGAITAQLIAQNEMVREAVESQVALLKDSLNEQGIKVEAVEVTVGSRQFEENQDSQSERQEEKRTKKHISKEELNEINGQESVQEKLEKEIMKQDGSTVSIRA